MKVDVECFCCNCYITYGMDFGLFLVTPCALANCHVVISKQGDGSVSGQSGPIGV